MSMSVVYSAPIVAVAEDIEPGDVLVFDDSASPPAYALSTAVKRAELGGRRSTGVAQTAGNVRTAVVMMVTGPVPKELIPDLGTGAEGWVRVSALGRLERVVSVAPSDDIMGWVDTTGRVTALMPAADAGDSANVATPGALEQAHWYIDAVNGSDTNDGASALTPIRTDAERQRRLGPPRARIRPPVNELAFSRVCTLHYLSTLPATDPVNLSLVLTQDVTLRIVGGVDTVVATGTFTSVTVKNPGADTHFALTDTSLPSASSWTPLLGNRVRITSGARANAVMWVSLDLGAKAMRPSDPSTIPAMTGVAADSFLSRALVPVTPQVGDAYAVERLRAITLGVFDVQAEGASNFDDFYLPQVVFGELSINDRFESDITPIESTNVAVGSYSCHFGGYKAAADDGYSLNDGIGPSANGSGGALRVLRGHFIKSGGLVVGSAGAPHSLVQVVGGMLVLNYDSHIQQGQLQGTNFRINSASISDCPSTNSTMQGHAVNVGGEFTAGIGTSNAQNTAGGGASLGRYTDDTNVRLWGSGNAGAGVGVQPGCCFSYPSATPPTITGTGGNFQLAGASSARAFNESTNVYSGTISNTWANLATAVGSGGFGGSAHNVAKDAHIVGE